MHASIRRAFFVFVIAAALGCVGSIDKILAWREAKAGDGDRLLAAALVVKDASVKLGVHQALRRFECSLKPFVNDTYKNLGDCPKSASLFDLFGPANAFAAETQPATTETSPTAKRPLKSLVMIGDSLAMGIQKSFEKLLAEHPGVSFDRVTKISSGLNNPDVFNWEIAVKDILQKNRPDALLVMLGVNDANNNIRLGDVRAVLGTPLWPETYKKKVDGFVRIMTDQQVKVFWVGMPVVKDPAANDRIKIANEAAKTACDAVEGCTFIDAFTVLADEKGAYSVYVKGKDGANIRVRDKDGVHFSTEGGDLLSRHILDNMLKHVEPAKPAESVRPM